jgi:lysophospholipase L1-like esterase
MVAIKLNGRAGMTIARRTSNAAVPARPTGLILIGGDNTVKVFWNMVDDATGYDVQSSTDGVTWSTISAAQTPNSYNDTAAPASASPITGLINYRVRAKNGTGSSSWTSSLTASPYILFDATNGLNGTLAPTHTPNIQLGNPYNTPSDGTVQITNNKFVPGTSASSGVILLTMETGQKDVVMTGLIQIGDSICLRVINAANRWLVGVSSNRFSLFEIKAGVATEKDFKVVATSTGVDYAVAVTVIGKSISASLNGANDLSATISSSYAAALSSTLHGWSLNNSGAISKLTIAAASPLPGMIGWWRGLNGATADTWSDQSHNGADATQATGDNQMTVQTNVLNGQTVMRANAASIMNFSNIQPTSASFTKIALFKSSDLTKANHLMSGSNADGAHAFFLNSTQFPESAVYASGSPVKSIGSTIGVGSPQANWALAILNAWFSDPASSSHINPDTLHQSLYVNGIGGAFTRLAATTMPSSGTLSLGGLQGSTTAGFTGDIAELLLSTTAGGPSAADMNRLIAMINNTYALSIPFFTKQVLYIGDSITAGYIASAGGGSWASTIAASAPTRWHVNKGQASIGAEDIVAMMSVQHGPIAGCGVETACVVFVGTNSIALYSKTGAQVYASLQTICQTLRASGASKIVVVTMLPRSVGTEIERQNLNNALRSDYESFADALADVETLSMGAAGANANTTWYNADGTHPNDTGHGLLAGLISGVMTPIW